MKRNYIKPELLQESIILNENILLDGSKIPVTDEEGGQGNFGSNNRRGEWGNVWSK